MRVFSLYNVRTRQEGGYLQTRRKVLTRHRSCWHLISDFPTSRTVRNQRLLCKPLSLCPNRLRQMSFSEWSCCTCLFTVTGGEGNTKRTLSGFHMYSSLTPCVTTALLSPDDQVVYLCQDGDSFPHLLVPGSKD